MPITTAVRPLRAADARVPAAASTVQLGSLSRGPVRPSDGTALLRRGHKKLHQLVLHLILLLGDLMRTTVTLDDELLSQARSYTGIQENSALIQQALKTLVQREAARRLALLGGSAPGLTRAPRRQTKMSDDPR